MGTKNLGIVGHRGGHGVRNTPCGWKYTMGWEMHQRSPEKVTKSELAASPLPSRGPISGRNCYVTPAFSGVSKEGDKIRIGCLTPTFLEAHKLAELLQNPSNLGGPRHRGQNQNWLPPLPWGPTKKGTKSQLADSPLPCWGPSGGRNCYVTLAFSGVPKQWNKITIG